jgi:hypothetical protein
VRFIQAAGSLSRVPLAFSNTVGDVSWPKGQIIRRRGVSGRGSTSIFGLLLTVVCLLGAAGSSSMAATDSSGVRITSGGKIGPLDMDRSDMSAIVAFAGEPEVDEVDAGAYPGSGWEALGYRCGPEDTSSPLVATAGAQGPYCRTVYYLNSKTDVLGTFFTSMPGFRDAHGVFVGMRTAKADRLEGKKATGGCGQGIFRTTPSGTYHVVITGGHTHRRGNELVVRGGRVGALVLHSRTNDVGVFDCL